MGKLYLNPVTTVNLSKGLLSSNTTTGTREESPGIPRHVLVAMIWPFRPALNVTEPSDFMMTIMRLFSPGARRLSGPKVSPSVKMWAFSFDRFVTSAEMDKAAAVALPVVTGAEAVAPDTG
jgi:hypothetical protein